MDKIIVSVLSVLLCASAVFSCYPYIKNTEIFTSITSGLDFMKNEKGESDTQKAPDTESTKDTAKEETSNTVTDAGSTLPETTLPESTAPATTPPVTTAPQTQAPQTTPPQTAPQTTPTPVVTESGTDYAPPAPITTSKFDNSLFIGDSRTVGLNIYGGLGKADVFATKGMTVFRAFNETIGVRSCGETKLEPLLESKKYDRVYIMLGLNEIGSDIERGIKPKYIELVNKVREAQPDATIYLCANLHITHARSEKDSTYNNTRLNAINSIAASLCDGTKVIYVDANQIFDDSNKALGGAYCTDDFHPIPKYYKQWVAWLATVT